VLTTFAEAPLVFEVELDVEAEDVLELVDEEVFEAVPFEEEEEDDTELFIVVPVAEWVESMAEEVDAEVDTVPVPDAEVDVVGTALLPELVVVPEETLEPPVIWKANEYWKVLGWASSVRFRP
jgi:hypothetical protein